MDKKYPYYGAASLMDYVDNYLFNGVYLLLGEDGTVVTPTGTPVLQYVWDKFWVNNHAHVLQGKNGFSTELLYLLLKNINISSIVTGAVQLKINQTNLKSLPIVKPTMDEIRSINNSVDSLFKLIRENYDENKFLIKIRNLLLPKLISGEISVSELSEVVE